MPREGAPPVVLAAGGLAGLCAAITVSLDRPGIGWLLGGIGVAVGVATVARGTALSRVERLARVGWAALALGLLAVGTFRAAGWLFVLCVLGACVAGSLAVSGGRSAGQVLRSAVDVPLTAFLDLPWLGRGVVALRGRSGGQMARLVMSVLVGLVLVVVFGALFAGADATFARLVSGALPTVRGGSVFTALLVFGLAACGTATAGRLSWDKPVPVDARRRAVLRIVEWAVPVGLLVLLFAVFVADQLAARFGGADYVLRTAGLTSAQYARSGFWQLLVVTALTLVVIAVTATRADRTTATGRIWVRCLLGALACLTLVIVASALSRMWSYQQAYGFTVLRLGVETCEVWLGAVYLLVIAAGVRIRLHWLPRAAVASCLVALLGLAVVNPEGLIARQNVLRWQQTGRIDRDYLAHLSQDAVPSIAALPGDLRRCVLWEMAVRIGQSTDDWQDWNASRATARPQLVTAATTSPVNC